MEKRNKKTNLMLTAVTIVTIIAGVSLLIAIVCCLFLHSDPRFENDYYYMTGGLAAFFIVFPMLSRCCIKTFDKISKPEKEEEQCSDKMSKSEKEEEQCSDITCEHVKNKSTYDPSYKDESNRLNIQSIRYEKIDKEVFKHAVEDLLKNKSGLLALDIGCANGEVTVNRFGEFDNFSNIIGVDSNEKEIQNAQDSNPNREKFRFIQMDIEAPDFEEKIRSIIKKKYGKNSFDFIFSAFTLHHLSNPSGTVSTLHDLLDEGGILIARGSDDGSKICYPDAELMRRIIKKTSEKELKPSDRENGRKLYHQFFEAGFSYSNIKMFHQLNHTVGMDRKQREGLFLEGFQFRIHYLDRAINNGKKIEEYKRLKEDINNFKKCFMSPSFYYESTIYIALGIK